MRRFWAFFPLATLAGAALLPAQPGPGATSVERSEIGGDRRIGILLWDELVGTSAASADERRAEV